MATYRIIYRPIQCEERDESYSIAGHEGLMKFSPSRGFRSTTVQPSLVSNPPQLKFFYYSTYKAEKKSVCGFRD